MGEIKRIFYQYIAAMFPELKGNMEKLLTWINFNLSMDKLWQAQ